MRRIILSPGRVAAILDISFYDLDRLIARGQGPQVEMFGSRRGFALEKLELWLKENAPASLPALRAAAAHISDLECLYYYGVEPKARNVMKRAGLWPDPAARLGNFNLYPRTQAEEALERLAENQRRMQGCICIAEAARILNVKTASIYATLVHCGLKPDKNYQTGLYGLTPAQFDRLCEVFRARQKRAD